MPQHNMRRDKIVNKLNQKMSFEILVRNELQILIINVDRVRRVKCPLTLREETVLSNVVQSDHVYECKSKCDLNHIVCEHSKREVR